MITSDNEGYIYFTVDTRSDTLGESVPQSLFCYKDSIITEVNCSKLWNSSPNICDIEILGEFVYIAINSKLTNKDASGIVKLTKKDLKKISTYSNIGNLKSAVVTVLDHKDNSLLLTTKGSTGYCEFVNEEQIWHNPPDSIKKEKYLVPPLLYFDYGFFF